MSGSDEAELNLIKEEKRGNQPMSFRLGVFVGIMGMVMVMGIISLVLFRPQNLGQPGNGASLIGLNSVITEQVGLLKFNTGIKDYCLGYDKDGALRAAENCVGYRRQNRTHVEQLHLFWKLTGTGYAARIQTMPKHSKNVGLCLEMGELEKDSRHGLKADQCEDTEKNQEFLLENGKFLMRGYKYGQVQLRKDDVASKGEFMVDEGPKPKKGDPYTWVFQLAASPAGAHYDPKRGGFHNEKELPDDGGDDDDGW